MINLLLANESENNTSFWPLIIIAAIAALIITLSVLGRERNNKDGKVKGAIGTYRKKKLLTQTEIFFYNDIKIAIGGMGLEVIPQINLASVITKAGKGYQNELFRNADFGIFDSRYNIIALIELNDKTHLRDSRKERDEKVKQICEMAQIPLLTYWTTDNTNSEKIRNDIQNVLNNQKF